MPKKIKLLADTIFFTGLSENDLEKILAFSSEKYYRNGQIIFQKGDLGDSLWIVLKGQIRISTSSDSGREIILNTILPGEVFGEIAFIDGLERSATATAVAESTLLIIRRADFFPFLIKHPEISIQWLKLLCGKLRDTSDRVEVVGLLPVAISLARFLIRAAEERGENYSEGLLLDWKKSQQEIGNEIGVSRESVNKQLNQWKKQGILRLGGQSLNITILDLKTLRKIAYGFG